MPEIEDLKALKKKRSGHRGRCTVLANDITGLLAAETPDFDRLQMSCDELERQCCIISNLDESIIQHLKEDEYEAEISNASENLMKYNLVVYKSKKRLSCPVTTTVEDRQTAHDATVILPQLSLVKFGGAPLDWLKFWELFRSSVHERQDIKAPIKFQYLVSQLEGDAANLISGFNHSAAEYAEAVDLLRETYGQPKLLVHARLKIACFKVNPHRKYCNE